MTNDKALTNVTRVYRLFVADLRSLCIDDSAKLNQLTRDFITTTMMYAQNRMSDLMTGETALPSGCEEWSDSRIINDILLSKEVEEE